MLKKQSDIKAFILIFVGTLFTRVLFKVFSGYNNFELFGDSVRYDMLSDRILSNNYDLDIVAFIPAPLYPYLAALSKLISMHYWEEIMVAVQFIMVSLSSFYIYKITQLLFNSVGQSYLAALLFMLYPMTMWYNFTICQEPIFQSLFIFFIYYFLQFLKVETYQNLLLASSCFALAFLTKSHITILLPFLALILLYKSSFSKTIFFFLVMFLFTLPHGIVNYKIHGIYTLSSYGSHSLLLAGHSDETYPCLTDAYFKHDYLQENVCDLNIVFHKPYELKNFGNINGLPIYERNKMWKSAAIAWIKANPKKFIELKWNGLKRFLMPGLDYRVYKFNTWLMSFIIGLLFYVPAYLSLFKLMKQNFTEHALTLSIITTIFIIFMVFYPQQRFRLITLEPLLFVYASWFYWPIIKRIKCDIQKYFL